MRMTRRNVLVGLGTIVTSGGVALGTGAFSTVEANRTVSVNTSGDDSANLELYVDSSYKGIGGGGDTIEINGQDLNLSGITRMNSVLTIAPDGSSGPYSIDILESFGGTSIARSGADTSSNGANMQFVANGDSSDVQPDSDGTFSSVSQGDAVVYDIVFNLRNVSSTGSVTTGITDNSIVIDAR